MKGRNSVPFSEVREKVFNGELVEDVTIRSRLTKTNSLLHNLESPLRFNTDHGCVVSNRVTTARKPANGDVAG